jgi:hypothetical protein
MCECSSYLLKVVKTKRNFSYEHCHSCAFLLVLICAMASSAQIGQELGCGLYKKIKSILVGATALNLNLMKDFSLQCSC